MTGASRLWVLFRYVGTHRGGTRCRSPVRNTAIIQRKPRYGQTCLNVVLQRNPPQHLRGVLKSGSARAVPSIQPTAMHPANHTSYRPLPVLVVVVLVVLLLERRASSAPHAYGGWSMIATLDMALASLETCIPVGGANLARCSSSDMAGES